MPAVRLACVFGTRPEAIKMAPILLAARRRSDVVARAIVTGQHREMLDQTLAVFEIAPDVDLALMRPGSTLIEMTARFLPALAEALAREQPDVVLVQGDTLTAFVGALAAFYLRMPVGHVEAGLRSGDMADPFPEEMNRRLTAPLASFHFAPTARSRDNLLREGVSADAIHVTGNTVIDALHHVAGSRGTTATSRTSRTILMTMHRRENLGEPMARVCRAVLEVLAMHPDVRVVFPMHPNPAVRQVVRPLFEGHPRVTLTEPADYPALVDLLRSCYLCLTDSGGLQEEAPAFGRPVLVLRETTERPEAVEAGCARLIGTGQTAVRANLEQLLDRPDEYARMARTTNPFGDGHAAERILTILGSAESARHSLT